MGGPFIHLLFGRNMRNVKPEITGFAASSDADLVSTKAYRYLQAIVGREGDLAEVYAKPGLSGDLELSLDQAKKAHSIDCLLDPFGATARVDPLLVPLEGSGLREVGLIPLGLASAEAAQISVHIVGRPWPPGAGGLQAGLGQRQWVHFAGGGEGPLRQDLASCVRAIVWRGWIWRR